MSKTKIMPTINKLKGMEDYNDWKFAMKMLLLREKLWTCIQICPDPNKVDEIDRDSEALSLICLYVEPNIYPYVRETETAKHAWDNLARVFEDKGVNRRISLLDSLLGEKLNNHNSIHDYVTAVMTTANKLKDIGKGIDDELVAVVLLRGLPDEYKPLRMALEHSGMEITSENVRAKLLQEDLRKGNGEDKVLLTETNKGWKPKKGIVRCFKCGKKGHKKPDCPLLIGVSSNSDMKAPKTKKNVSLHAVYGVGNFSATDWYIDSGASNHMSFNRDWFTYVNKVNNVDISCANKQKMTISGVGDIKIKLNNNVATVNESLYIPDLSANLLSVSKLVSKGLCVVFNSLGCSIYDEKECKLSIHGNVVASAREVGGIYKLNNCKPVALSAVREHSKSLWHRRLGHVNEQSMKLLKDGLVSGVTYTEANSDAGRCIACIQGKQHRLPFDKSGGQRAKEKLQLVHMDLCGPMDADSYNGARYMLLLIDDYTRKVFIYFLRNKYEVFDSMKDFTLEVEKETDLKIKTFRSDNGTEFVNSKINNFLKERGIKHQLTVPYTPEQNGVAERTIRTITEMTRCMLLDSELPKKLWAEAANTAVYIKNRLPHSANKGRIPEEMWTGNKVDLSHLKVFGSTAYVHVPHQLRKGKWGSKSKRYIFVGYCLETKGYRLFDTSNPKKIIRARDVIFLEEKRQNHNDSHNYDEMVYSEIVDNERSVQNHNRDTIIAEADSSNINIDLSNESISRSDDSENVIPQVISERHQSEDENIHEEPELRRSLRPHRPLRDPDFVYYHAVVVDEDEPLTVSEALSRTDNDDWKRAMQNEFDSMRENNVWELVDRPTNAKIIRCKWVFKLKRDADDNIKHKARLVAKGFTQSYGVDYFETFSPVVRRATLRLLFALAAQYNLCIDHFDVSTAFLNGDLDETIYMTQPEGYNVDSKKVCLLKKAIYGLKQAPRCWNKKATEVLMTLGYKQLESEPCVYIKRNNDKLIIIALYVDDFFVFHNNADEKSNLFTTLNMNFKIRDLGEARQCLGMRLRRNSDGGVSLDQKQYILSVLDKFGMSDCKTAPIPLDTNVQDLFESDTMEVIDCPYQSLIGALNYLAVNSRPDIAHALSLLSQYNNKYKKIHWESAKHVLRYLKGTLDYCLEFKKRVNSSCITGFVDADWGSSKDRRSYSGQLFKVYGNPVSWDSKKQRCVSLSSTEAEYVAVTEACKEALFLRRIFTEVTGCNLQSVTLLNDNQSAIKLAYNPVFHNRTKHIDIRMHFVRECLDKGYLTLSYMSTENMPADVLTKLLPKVKHMKCVKNLGLVQGMTT